ncbi:hypothetical protein [Solimicrobium silvestre]|uniref:Uncharacterized protein n=1 Tax=Solimicrobium silvestre TaxID=2099400 RepID=A0A2S9GVV7_9BURK|nr:hypothetical protein [Solimicrobium silvestre]PRC91841.1 hypothetical protein S2091_3397 [Solimicrobium silvestre]
MTENYSLRIQAAYLGKVMIGLLVLTGLGFASSIVDAANLSKPVKDGAFVALILAALTIPFLIGAVYRRMDELQRRLHEQACMFSPSVSFSAAFVAGILQSHQVVPEFSAFWICACVIASWGLSLVIADRQFK